MARIFCMTTGLTGILYASLELCRRMQGQGHEVVYACPQDVEKTVLEQGLQFIKLPPVNFNPSGLPSPIPGLLSQLKHTIQRNLQRSKYLQQGIAALRMQEFQAIIEGESPDVILADVELAEHIIRSYTLDTPLILLSQWFKVWENKNFAPLDAAFQPLPGTPGHPSRIKKLWKKNNQRRWLSLLKQRLLHGGTDRYGVLKAYARQVGFEDGLLDAYAFPPPFSYRHIPVMSMNLMELDFPDTYGSEYYYIGPMVSDERSNPNLEKPDDASLSNFLGEVEVSRAPLIYCNVSSMNVGDLHFIDKLINATKDQVQWRVLISLGGKAVKESWPNLPKHILLVTWAPQLSVLGLAACSINHGGIHTINECVHFQVPMLIYSGKKHDQNGCAARIEHHGLGIRGDKDLDQVQDILQKIKSLLEDKQIAQNLQAMHATYLRYKKEQAWQELIHKYANGKKSMSKSGK